MHPRVRQRRRREPRTLSWIRADSCEILLISQLFECRKNRDPCLLRLLHAAGLEDDRGAKNRCFREWHGRPEWSQDRLCFGGTSSASLLRIICERRRICVARLPYVEFAARHGFIENFGDLRRFETIGKRSL